MLASALPFFDRRDGFSHRVDVWTFTVERANESQDIQLLPSLRYAHSEAYVRRLADEARFTSVLAGPDATFIDARQDVRSLAHDNHHCRGGGMCRRYQAAAFPLCGVPAIVAGYIALVAGVVIGFWLPIAALLSIVVFVVVQKLGHSLENCCPASV